MSQKEEKITLFNVGTKFAVLTKGTMTPYYQAETFKPFNYINVQELIDKNVVIEIRPATTQEMNWSYKELEKYYYNNSNI